MLTLTEPQPVDTTRPADPAEILRQVGAMNVLAIAGGVNRCVPHIAGIGADSFVDGVTMHVRYGYTVEIVLAADDTYTVRRVFTRGHRSWVKWERTGVYCTEVGDAAYQASCYLDT